MSRKSIFILLSMTFIVLSFLHISKPKKQQKINCQTNGTGVLLGTSNYGMDSVDIIDLKKSDRHTISTVNDKGIGAGPTAGAFSPDGKKFYTANFDSSSISKIDINRHELEKVIELENGAFPYGIAVSANNMYYASANSFSDNIVIFDAKSDQITKTISLRKGTYPYSLIFSDDSRWLLSANRFSDSITVIEMSSMSEYTTIPLDRNAKPTSIALSSDNQYLYSANRGDNSISKIDLRQAKVTQTIKLEADFGPRWVEADTNNNDVVFAVGQTSNKIASIESTNSSIKYTSLQDDEFFKKNVGSMGVIVLSDKIYATSMTASTVVRLDNSLEKQEAIKLDSGSRPYHLAMNKSNNCAQSIDIPKNEYVPEAINKSISELNVCAAKEEFLSRKPFTLIRNQNMIIGTNFYTSEFVLTNPGQNNTVLDMGVGTRPREVVLNQALSRAYVVREGANSVSEISIKGEIKLVRNIDLPSYSGPLKIAMTIDDKALLVSTISDKYFVISLNEADDDKVLMIDDSKIVFQNCEKNTENIENIEINENSIRKSTRFDTRTQSIK